MRTNQIKLKKTENLIRISLIGYEYDYYSNYWKLSKDNYAQLDWIEKLEIDLRSNARQTINYFAQNKSGSHTDNISDRMTAFVGRHQNIVFSSELLINYRQLPHG